MIERYRHLHPRIRQIVVTVAQQHHLVVVREMVVRYGNPGGSHHHVDQSIGTVRQRAVVDPDIFWSENGDAVAVGFAAVSVVGGAGSNVRVAGRDAVVDVDVVDDDISDELEGDTAAADDMHVGTTAVEGFVAVEDELLYMKKKIKMEKKISWFIIYPIIQMRDETKALELKLYNYTLIVGVSFIIF